MDNKLLIETFYKAFQNKDWEAMHACYHPSIHFSDPVFPDLKGKEAKAMWHMLLAASTDLRITFDGAQASHDTGTCHWEAYYSFSRTGGKVHNKIDATFTFKEGLIAHHTDTFDLWKWSKMALGTSGLLFGWSSFMKQKIRKMAAKNLAHFIAKNPSYQ